MAGERPASIPDTSVPSVENVGNLGGGFSQRASPEAFGSQVGGALTDVGGEAFQQAQQWQGFINETKMNNAEVAFIKDSGDLKAKYSQYEGLQADAMRPQYEAQLSALHQQYRQGLPPTVQRAFDSTTMHQMAYQTSEYSQYAAGQVKSANLKSQDAIADTQIAGAGDLGKVLNENQFQWGVGSIQAAGNHIADIHGDSMLATGTDDGKGNYSYPNTPEGQAAQSRHMQYTNTKLAQYYLTAAKTIADNQGATAAAEWGQKHWDEMPDQAKVLMNQFIAPKMKNEIISGNIATENARLDQGWNKQIMSNVPGSPTADIPKNALDVIRQNEGYTGKVGQDSNGYNVLNGINEKSFPTEYAEAKRLLDTEGKASADKYADDFYQKNIIDKYDIKSLPANTQAIVADGIVNHGGGDFGQSLIAAAKNGATPQQLIDMRRAEYQRLANSDTDGSKGYAASLKGWNSRLDGLHQQGFQNYPNKAEFLRSHEEDAVQNSYNAYLQRYPDDYYGAQIQERRARTDIQRQIGMEDARLKSDRDTITSAIGGSQTKGVPPTLQQLRAISGMGDTMDRVMREQGGFFGTIDTMIAKASHQDLSQNSANAYDTIHRTLLDTDDPNAIRSQDHLSHLLGDNHGTGITWKDFQDAKPALDLGPDTKKVLRTKMEQISVANGNIDGQGQQRATQYYNGVMNAIKVNNAKGDKKENENDVINEYNEKMALNPPSTIKQIENWAVSLFKSQPNIVNVINPDGQSGTIPADKLEKALAAGYKKAG